MAPLLVSAGLLLASLAGAVRHRVVPGARSLAVMVLGHLGYLSVYAGELFSPSLEVKSALDDLSWPFVALAGGAMIHLAGQYTRRRRRAGLALGIYAVAMTPLVLSMVARPLKGLSRPGARLIDGEPFLSLAYDFTVEDMFGLTLFLLANLGVLWLLLVDSWASPRRPAAVLLGIGFLGPTMLSYVGLLAGVSWLGQRDINPLVVGWFDLLVMGTLVGGRTTFVPPVARELVVEGLVDPALVVDGRDRVLDANPAARRLLGLGEPGPGRTVELPAVLQPALRLTGGGTCQLALGAIHATARVSPVPDDRLPAGSRVIHLHDTSELHAAAEAVRRARDELELRVAERTAELEDRERTLRTLFDNTLQFMGLLAPDGRLLVANHAALELVGVRPEQVIGLPFWSTPWFMHDPGLQAKLEAAVGRAREGHLVRFEVTHRDRRGVLRAVDFSLNPVLDGAGQASVLIAEGRDLSEARQAEERRLSLEQQVHHLQRLESLGRLAGSVAHDFNNLLTAITGNATVARESVPQGSLAAEALDDVLHAAGSAATLTRQLLALGRKQPTPVGRVAMKPALEKLKGLLVPLCDESVTLEIRCPGDAGDAAMDPGQLEQVLTNLAVNARDAMPEGGRLTIAAEVAEVASGEGELPPGQYIELTVADTGTGMSPEVKARAFEPFFTTKPEGQGTGLGLATVYAIVRNVGGRVTLESAPGQGTRFRILVPRLERAPAEPPVRAPAVSAPGTERVLVVEDRSEVISTVERVLSGCGYQVDLARDATEALERLERAPVPDLLLTDVRMPGMNGPSLAARVRRMLPGLPVLFMTGYTDVPLPVMERSFVLAKPFTPGALASAVRLALDGPTADTTALRA